MLGKSAVVFSSVAADIATDNIGFSNDDVEFVVDTDQELEELIEAEDPELVVWHAKLEELRSMRIPHFWDIEDEAGYLEDLVQNSRAKEVKAVAEELLAQARALREKAQTAEYIADKAAHESQVKAKNDAIKAHLAAKPASGYTSKDFIAPDEDAPAYQAVTATKPITVVHAKSWARSAEYGRLHNLLPPGVNTVAKKNDDGTTTPYYYAWKGGPRLKGKPGSKEFLESYANAHRERKAGQRQLLSPNFF